MYEGKKKYYYHENLISWNCLSFMMFVSAMASPDALNTCIIQLKKLVWKYKGKKNSIYKIGKRSSM
jgi:hypothetical protein